MVTAMKHAPVKMAWTPKTQCHETPATLMKPLTIGPNEGPAKGARVNTARAFPRVSASQISEMTALRSTQMLERDRRKHTVKLRTRCSPGAPRQKCHRGSGRAEARRCWVRPRSRPGTRCRPRSYRRRLAYARLARIAGPTRVDQRSTRQRRARS